MSMNAHVFRRVCEALAPKLLGARLEKIHALSDEVTQWAFYGHGEKFSMLWRAHRQKPFVCTAARRIAVGAEPPSAIMRLRKYLGGQRVTAVFVHWTARRLWLRFMPGMEVWLRLDLREGAALFWQAPEELGQNASAQYDLGQNEHDQNEHDQNEHDQAFSAHGAMSPIVEGEGISYGDPVWPSLDDLAKAGPDAWRSWAALSPLLRRTLPLLPPEEQAALLADLETGGGDLFVYRDKAGDGDVVEISAWPLPEPLRGGREEEVYEDPLAAARAVGERLVVAGLAEEAARHAARPYAAEEARLIKLLSKLEQEEVRLSAMAAVQEEALALQCMLYAFDPAEKRPGVDVETGTGIRHIALDPRLTVRANMAALFHRAGRGRRGLVLLGPRRDAVSAELAGVRARGQVAAGIAPSCEASFGHPGGHTGGKSRRQDSGKALVSGAAARLDSRLPKGVQAFRSSDGLLLLRGKDARGNLAALKMGRPDDVWLHVEGTAGAHVILRRIPGRDVPARSLHEAGILAALKSPYREAGTAMIQSALVRHVHPMRGATPGTVRIDRHEPGLTVHIEPDLEARLTTA